MFKLTLLPLVLMFTSSIGFASVNCSKEAEQAATAIETINSTEKPMLSIPIEETSVDLVKESIQYEAHYDFNTYAVTTNFQCRILQVYLFNRPK